MKKSPLFINLSNHPLDQWDEKQRAAAAQFGEAQDMPFPQIDPDASNDDIEALVNDYVAKIITLAERHDVTVHIMGEMVFTYRLVQHLKEHNIRCVASTAQRNVIQRDNTKIAVFNFVEFREY